MIQQLMRSYIYRERAMDNSSVIRTKLNKLGCDRKWADLEMDCLAMILGKVGLESLMLVVPFVCRSWYEASLHPLCWRVLDYSHLSFDFYERLMRELGLRQFSMEGFLKLLAHRSRGSITHLIVNGMTFACPLSRILDQFLALKVLAIPRFFWHPHGIESVKLISKWRNLEWLYIEDVQCPFQEILTEIKHHCKNFVGLKVCGHIESKHAQAIVDSLPKLKYLNVNESFIRKPEMITILKGCKELQELHVKDCLGFCVDDEMLRYSPTTLKFFNWQGSKVEDAKLTLLDYTNEMCKPYCYNPKDIVLRTIGI